MSEEEYNETLKLAESFNQGAIKGAAIFAFVYGIGGALEKW